jgi:LysM repeat protein
MATTEPKQEPIRYFFQPEVYYRGNKPGQPSQRAVVYVGAQPKGQGLSGATEITLEEAQKLAKEYKDVYEGKYNPVQTLGPGFKITYEDLISGNLPPTSGVVAGTYESLQHYQERMGETAKWEEMVAKGTAKKIPIGSGFGYIPTGSPADVLMTNPAQYAKTYGAEGVPGAAQPQQPTGATASFAPTPNTYTVKSGDTLSAIAARTGIPLATLKQLNPHLERGKQFNLIYPGDVVNLGTGGTTTAGAGVGGAGVGGAGVGGAGVGGAGVGGAGVGGAGVISGGETTGTPSATLPNGVNVPVLPSDTVDYSKMTPEQLLAEATKQNPLLAWLAKSFENLSAEQLKNVNNQLAQAALIKQQSIDDAKAQTGLSEEDVKLAHEKAERDIQTMINQSGGMVALTGKTSSDIEFAFAYERQAYANNIARLDLQLKQATESAEATYAGAQNTYANFLTQQKSDYISFISNIMTQQANLAEKAKDDARLMINAMISSGAAANWTPEQKQQYSKVSGYSVKDLTDIQNAVIESKSLKLEKQQLEIEKIQAGLSPSTLVPGLTEREESAFFTMANQEVDKLKTGMIYWGEAWNRIKERFPTASNEVIDTALGGGIYGTREEALKHDLDSIQLSDGRWAAGWAKPGEYQRRKALESGEKGTSNNDLAKPG